MKKFVLDCLTTDGVYTPILVKETTYENAVEKAKTMKSVVEVNGLYDASKDPKHEMSRKTYPYTIVKNKSGKSIKIFS